MTSRSALLQLGNAIAKEISHGNLSECSLQVSDALASYPEAAMEILDLLVVELRKKRANSDTTSALLFMLEKALESARWRMENQSGAPTDVIENVRSKLRKAAASENISAKALTMIAQCFAAAKLDIGDDLRSRIQALSRQVHEASTPESAFAGYAQVIANLALELGDDSFLLHGQLTELFASFPVDQRTALISMLPFNDSPSVREAAAGWLLDANLAIANAATDFMAQAANKGLVSGTTVNRLITMRNWVSDQQRSGLDAIIRAARKNGVSVAATSVIQISEIMVSSCDGAGAQSYFVTTRQKRKMSVACLLFKHGFGIRDAWVRHGMTAVEAETFIDEVDYELDCFESSLDAVQSVLAHGLAVSVQANEPVPFGLLQFIEAIGVSSVTPEYLKPEQLLDRLFEEMPADRRSETDVSRALSGSKRWMGEFTWLESWFEDSEAALQAVRSERTIKARTEAVLQRVIAERRKRWAELLAWTALAARDEAESDDWIKLALVAKELMGERPISDIPLANVLAANTVDALKGRL